ncbi:MAG: type II toxin-antitoxin system prevent-host-death family antitoxin [Candidatus Marinimicrobia bacterium]|nr:type II toxin-antitoxin system prevent-host-death family antitoxin [Candidatus Neomarinimicrobiota bacterium]MCF7827956.1 type II toxin-antitoxin system prevent-host-death family antitoxin [Candidatus Neomarinimicrobiota bacterium]MCF7879289.1 type II toxin-antitoxin system prevent-host-death family antitoxin [Candidatus Neomarinimicrobiota bacterium]
MKLSQFVEEVSETDNPISITRNGEAIAVLLSQETFDGWHETMEIMRDVDFYKTILKSMHELSRGEGLSLTSDELFRDRLNAKKTYDQPVRIKVLPPVKKALQDLHPETQQKIFSYLKKLSEKEVKGTMLKNGLEGLAYFRLGKYRLFYRWKVRSIELVMIDLRETVYQQTITL